MQLPVFVYGAQTETYLVQPFVRPREIAENQDSSLEQTLLIYMLLPRVTYWWQLVYVCLEIFFVTGYTLPAHCMVFRCQFVRETRLVIVDCEQQSDKWTLLCSDNVDCFCS